jgi:DNA (cytosine-5)-methyltransferase 1
MPATHEKNGHNNGNGTARTISRRSAATGIPHLDALKIILSVEAAHEHPESVRAELPAIISHWLQSPKFDPLVLGSEARLRWTRILAAYDRTGKRPPVETPDLPKNAGFAIDFSGLPFPPVQKHEFTFIDLFAGIGGFRIPLQELGGKCVFTSEWDKHAKQTYLDNHGEVPFGDIRNFTGESLTNAEIKKRIPDHDVLCAGFPCQPFSRAGVSARTSLGQKHGFSCEIQGTLFFDLMRIAAVKRPKVLFLENVKNLKAHDEGRTFERIKKTIEEDLGYSFHWDIVDASSLVPQKRKRCYMVCFRDKRPFKFPLFAGIPMPLSSILEKDPGDSYTISDRMWQGHIKRTQRNIDRGAGFTAYEVDINKPASTLVARYYKDGKECLVPQKGENPRLLTPRECARLQGYPEKFKVHSWTMQAYRQFGNSVAVPVVRLIAKELVGEMRRIK